MTLTWNITGTAVTNSTLSVGAQVGTASNGFENFVVFKDNDKFMFTNADGFQCSKIYFVFH